MAIKPGEIIYKSRLFGREKRKIVNHFFSPKDNVLLLKKKRLRFLLHLYCLLFLLLYVVYVYIKQCVCPLVITWDFWKRKRILNNICGTVPARFLKFGLVFCLEIFVFTTFSLYTKTDFHNGNNEYFMKIEGFLFFFSFQS